MADESSYIKTWKIAEGLALSVVELPHELFGEKNHPRLLVTLHSPQGEVEVEQSGWIQKLADHFLSLRVKHEYYQHGLHMNLTGDDCHMPSIIVPVYYPPQSLVLRDVSPDYAEHEIDNFLTKTRYGNLTKDEQIQRLVDMIALASEGRQIPAALVKEVAQSLEHSLRIGGENISHNILYDLNPLEVYLSKAQMQHVKTELKAQFQLQDMQEPVASLRR